MATNISNATVSGGGGVMRTMLLQLLANKQQERARLALEHSEQQARGLFPDMPGQLQGNGFNPAASPENLLQYGVNLLQHGETQEQGMGVLEMALRQNQANADRDATSEQNRATAEAALAQARNQQHNQQMTQRAQITTEIQPYLRGLEPLTALMNSVKNVKPGFAGGQVALRSFAKMLSGGGPLTQADVDQVIQGPGVAAGVLHAWENWILNKTSTDDELLQVKAAMAQLYKDKRDSVIQSLVPMLRVGATGGFAPTDFVNPGQFVTDDVLDPLIAYTEGDAERARIARLGRTPAVTPLPVIPYRPGVNGPVAAPAAPRNQLSPEEVGVDITTETLAAFLQLHGKVPSLPGETPEEYQARVVPQ